jgi:hypothetical protein
VQGSVLVEHQTQQRGQQAQQEIDQMRPVERHSGAGGVARHDLHQLVLPQCIVQPHQPHVAVGILQPATDHAGQLVRAGGERDQHRQQRVERALLHADVQRSFRSGSVARHRRDPTAAARRLPNAGVAIPLPIRKHQATNCEVCRSVGLPSLDFSNAAESRG